MNISLSTLAILLVGIGVVAKVLWTLYLSPLARQRIPGPKRAAVSDLWDYWMQFRGCRTFVVHDLFERHGPVVRVGPNRVAFRNIEAVKAIYTTHRFRKSSWWNALTFGGEHNMLSTSDPVYHGRCRRLSAPAFRGDNIRAAGDVLVQKMENLVERLRRDCADGSCVDVMKLFQLLSLDILGLTILGVHFNQIATEQESEFGKHLESWILDKVLVNPLPGIVRKLPIRRLQEILAGDPAIAGYVRDLYTQVDDKPLDERSNMMTLYKAYRDPETGEPAPLPLAVSELSIMFVAGMENTALSLVHVAYCLALHEDMWNIMRSEVGTTKIQAENFVETLRGLPYLNAFIRETLRVHGPTSLFLERIVPPGGATLDGYFIPGGTKVGSQAYSFHFDQQTFPQPHQIDPLRWVRLDNATGKYVNREDITPEMNSRYFPFGAGVRGCIGKALAELEQAFVATTLVQNFRIHLYETTTPESMSPIEIGSSRPRGGRCLLRFEHAPLAAA